MSGAGRVETAQDLRAGGAGSKNRGGRVGEQGTWNLRAGVGEERCSTLTHARTPRQFWLRAAAACSCTLLTLAFALKVTAARNCFGTAMLLGHRLCGSIYMSAFTVQ